MSNRQLTGTTALVTGASRGFGRATAISLASHGAHVVGVARDGTSLLELEGELRSEFTSVVADIRDPDLPHWLLSTYRPKTLVLNAGATPLTGPVKEHTWDSFSENWNTDVRHVFQFVRETLINPLDPGSVVVSLSSGAALRGSPLSGGYAGAKATIRFLSSYAVAESQRAAMKVRYVALLPQLSPATDLGLAGARAYAAQSDVSIEEFVKRAPGLSVEQVGECITELATNDALLQSAYLLTSDGLQMLD